MFIKIWDSKEKIFTDQTGKFSHQSVDGKRYIMVMVENDSSYIDAEPMKDKTSQEMIKTYKELYRHLHTHAGKRFRC